MLMSTSIPAISLPNHFTYAASLHPLSNGPISNSNIATVDWASDSTGSDFAGEGSICTASEDDEDEYVDRKPITTRSKQHVCLASGISGHDELLGNATLTQSWKDDDSGYDTGSDVQEHDVSGDDDSDLTPLIQSSLRRVPSEVEFTNQPTSLFPFLQSWAYVPKRSAIPEQR